MTDSARASRHRTAGPVAADRVPVRQPVRRRPVTTIVDADGTERRYLTRRFIGSTDTATGPARAPRGRRRPAGPAWRSSYYGDPLLAWRIADANRRPGPRLTLTGTPGTV